MNGEERLMLYFWIMLGGALGSGARYWCSGFAAHHFGDVGEAAKEMEWSMPLWLTAASGVEEN